VLGKSSIVTNKAKFTFRDHLKFDENIFREDLFNKFNRKYENNKARKVAKKIIKNCLQ